MKLARHVKRLGSVNLAAVIYEPTLARAGSRPLLISRGFGMTKEDSHALAAVLCERHGHVVVTYDNRGSGESSSPPDTFRMVDMAHDCIALMQSLNFNQYNMFGASMGGYIAQNVALEDSAGLQKLILACTHFGGPNCLPPTKEYEALVTSPMAEDTSSDRWHEQMHTLFAINFTPEFAQESEWFHVLLAAFKHSEKTQVLRGKEAQYMAIKEFIAVGVEERIKAALSNRPTLIMSGDTDKVVPLQNSFLLQEAISGAELTIFENCGHMFWEQKRDQVAERIQLFLCK
jgi:pimeloyl-ACP methyl ester carboxylesterase